jgi:hypothetical protein
MAALHPLAGVVTKLRQADVHLVTLYNEFARYINSSPYRLQTKSDTGDGKPGVVFEVTKEPPIYLAAIVGDVVHNLRAALDYIAHELTIRNGAKPTRRTQFPIGLTEDDFLNQAITLKKFNTVSIDALKIASAFQPYRLDEDKRTAHFLWQLAKLSNMDKHHTLALAAVGTQVSASFTHPDGRTVYSEFKDALVHDRTVVATMPADFLHPKIKTNLKGTTRIGFMDAPLTDHEPVGVLQNIREFVGQLMLPAFEPFFEPLPDNLRLERHGLPPEVVAKPR